MAKQDLLWVVAGGSALLAVLAGVADWRRARRPNLDRVGWVPWQGIHLAAIAAALVSVFLALH